MSCSAISRDTSLRFSRQALQVATLSSLIWLLFACDLVQDIFKLTAERAPMAAFGSGISVKLSVVLQMAVPAMR
jgi:hypothetical protein